jgi:hypothetical protein
VVEKNADTPSLIAGSVVDEFNAVSDVLAKAREGFKPRLKTTSAMSEKDDFDGVRIKKV